MSLNQGFPVNTEARDTSIHLVMSGGGSEIEWLRGVLTVLSRQNITGVSGTSASAIALALYVSGYNTSGRAEGLRRLDNFCADIRMQGMHYLAARANPAFWFLSPHQKSRLWTKALMLSHDFMKACSIESPVKSSLESLLRKHIPDIKAVNKGPLSLSINTMTINPQTGEPVHHIHHAGDITFETIIASASLDQLGGTMINGDMHFDGGHLNNGFVDAALGNTMARNIVFVSTYPQHHDAESKKPIGGLSIKQGALHHDAFRAFMDDSHEKLLHVIAPDTCEADDIDRMNTDPIRLIGRYNSGKACGTAWEAAHAHHLGVQSTITFPRIVVDRVLFGEQHPSARAA